MGIIGNQKTTLWERTTDGQLNPAGTVGVVVALGIKGADGDILDLHDGIDATGTKIATCEMAVAGETIVFPVGFQPEFINGLFLNVTGTTPPCQVYTA